MIADRLFVLKFYSSSLLTAMSLRFSLKTIVVAAACWGHVDASEGSVRTEFADNGMYFTR